MFEGDSKIKITPKYPNVPYTKVKCLYKLCRAERKLASTEVWKSTKKAALEAEVKKIDVN